VASPDNSTLNQKIEGAAMPWEKSFYSAEGFENL
jgi:hypothetical protein